MDNTESDVNSLPPSIDADDNNADTGKLKDKQTATSGNKPAPHLISGDPTEKK